MTTLYIDQKLRIRASEKGWPEVPGNPDVTWLEQTIIDRHNAALDKAKEESLVVEMDSGSYNAFKAVHEAMGEFKPDSFVELPIEVEFVKQIKYMDQWNTQQEYGAYFDDMPDDTTFRTIARLKPDNGAHSFSEGSEVSESIFETNRKAYLRHWRITQFIKNDRQAQHWCKGSPCACMGCVNKGLSAEWVTLYPDESKITEDEFNEVMRTINNAHLTEQLDAANKKIVELEALKQVTIDYLKKQKDAPFMASSSGSFTTHQLADEIMNGTTVGVDCINGLLLLTIDQIARGKKNFNQPARKRTD